MFWRIFPAVGLAWLPVPVTANTADTLPVTVVDADMSVPVLPVGTLVDFEIVDPLSSKTSKVGDRFQIRTVRPVGVDEQIIIPVGTVGVGEVIHAAKARAAGKPGELILVARYLALGERQVPLKGFHFGQSGDSKRTEAFLLSSTIAAPLGFLVVGGQVDVAPGSPGHAKLASELAASIAVSEQQASIP